MFRAAVAIDAGVFILEVARAQIGYAMPRSYESPAILIAAA